MALTTGGGATQRRGSWAREHQPKSTGQYSSDHTVFARLLPHQAQSSVLEEQNTVAIKCYWIGQLALLARANLVCLRVFGSTLMCLLRRWVSLDLSPGLPILLEKKGLLLQ